MPAESCSSNNSTMTPEDFIRKIDKAIRNLETQNIPLKRAVQSAHALRISRIFNAGRKTDGGNIGEYSTKPMLVGAKSFFKKTSADKFFKKAEKWVTIKKAGVARHLAIMEGGYKELRQLQQRPVNYIDLGLTYDMRNDFANSAIGATDRQATQISVNEYQERWKREHNIDKSEGLTSRFGEIFPLSGQERNKFKFVLEFELQQLLK